MRLRNTLVPLLAGALLLTACGDDGDDASTDAAATDAPTATATENATDGATEPAAADLVSGDLPDGVAASVGDTEISVEALEVRLDAIRQIPQVQEQLQGEGAGQVEAQLQSQALGQLVLLVVVLQAAAGEDVEVDDAAVEERRTELADSAGGAEQFAEQLATAGVPEAQVDQELRASIAFELVTERLLADAGVETETPAEDGTAPPAANPEAQQVQQEWLIGVVSSTDVVVDEEYGAWDPNSGQVVAA